MKIIEFLYYRFLPNYPKELKKLTSSCSSLLDVGCGENSPVKFLSKKIFSVGIDVHKPSLTKSKQNKIHHRYFQMNVIDIDKKFAQSSFDLVLASDIIEHLDKKDGLKLIKKMEKIAKKRVIILTPNGFLTQERTNNNPWQLHLSGYSVKEMKAMGYKVFGINGWKPLKGVRCFVTLRPKYFWLLVSTISQFFVKDSPEHAFSLMCVKEKISGSKYH